MIDNISRYVYEVYRSRSVSEAAKKLFISQPALSASIKKAEAELGAPIFNRRTLPFTLTAEGRLYIDAVEQMLRIEEDTRNGIRDMGDLKSGTLTIATSTHISFYAIPRICEAFSKKFPGIDISIVFDSTADLPALLERGTADLIFTPSDSGLGGFVTEALLEERCVIAVRRDYRDAERLAPYALDYGEIISRSYGDDRTVTDLSIFGGLEFIYSPPNTNLYKKKKMFFGESGMSRHVITSTSNHQLNYNLMRSGFGALFTTDAAIAASAPSADCLYFALRGEDTTQSFLVAYSQDADSHSRRIAGEFIRVAKSLFDGEDPLAVFKC